MTKREESKIVKANHRKLYLKTWAEERARGISLPFSAAPLGIVVNDIRIDVVERLAVV